MDNHFFLITDLIHFLANGHPKPNRTLFCQHCLCQLTTKEALTIHKEVCEHPLQKLVYPAYEEPYKFDSYEGRVAVPIFGVADFEASLAPISRSHSATINNCSACVIMRLEIFKSTCPQHTVSCIWMLKEKYNFSNNRIRSRECYAKIL